MPETKDLHYAVKFAARYGAATSTHLNAWTALVRFEELIEDAKTLKGHLESTIPEEQRWQPWVGAEIVS